MGLVGYEVIEGNVNFEIKSQFKQELREDTFFGNKNVDAHDHVDQVLNIIDSLQELSTLGTSLKGPLSKGIVHHPIWLNDLKISITLSKKATNHYTKPGSGPSRYYTRTNNRPPYGEKRPSLKELLNKHKEESARRSAQMDEWIKKHQENAEINTRNQSASLKNLENQIEQLTKEIQSRTTNGAPSTSTK
nr:hypothetical protein [Tanacetum cinerariifolium]